MRVNQGWKLLLAALSLALLPGCPSPPRVPPAAAPAAGAPASVPGAPSVAAPRVGTPYEILPQASLLTILVYRGGALAAAGHNHVIASHDLSGAIYIPSAILQSSFVLHIPVATLTVDEAGLRAQQPAAAFPPDVSEGAKEGTRRNMLGEALLDGQRYPEIVLQSLRLEAADGADSGTVVAHVQSSVRGEARAFTVPVHYRLDANGRTIEASGELSLRQTELGLAPFSAMLGALQVQDEMRVSFHIVAQAAAVKGGQRGMSVAPRQRWAWSRGTDITFGVVTENVHIDAGM